jgi:hypothetical protein
MALENTEALIKNEAVLFHPLTASGMRAAAHAGGRSLWQFPLGDELVLARRDVQGLFLLNGTARFLWDEVSRGASLHEIEQTFVTRYGVPPALARQDIEATLGGWSQSLLGPTPGEGVDSRAVCASALGDFESGGTAVEINCLLNGRAFRVVLESGDLVEEIAPRLTPVAVKRLPPDAPFLTFTLLNGNDRVFVFRNGVCIAEEDKTSGARAILLQELTAHCDPGREVKAILHAGACGTASGCIILAGSSHAGKSTLCAALMAEGFLCYADDSAVLDGQFRVSGIPIPLTLRESSWPVLAARFPAFMNGASVHRRWECNVRFLPSNLPANYSPAVAPKALVLVDYQPRAATRLHRLNPFEALMALRQSGFWVQHDRESIGRFLAWIGELDSYRLTYSLLDEATGSVRALLAR